MGEIEPQPSRVGPDAAAVALAIERGWVWRGFQLGIGFWLAGLFIIVVSALFWVFVLAKLIGVGHALPSTPASVSDTDPRTWQEQLNASDEAAAAADKVLAQSRSRRSASEHH